MEDNTLSLSSKLVFRTLLSIACLLVMASISGQLIKFIGGHPNFFGLVDLFDLDHEQNIPTFFSVILLLICCLLLTLIFFQHLKLDRKPNKYWAVLSIGFGYMSIDEFCSIHENFRRLSSLLLGNKSYPLFHYAWVLPGLLIVISVGLFFRKFLLSLPRTTKINFVIAGLIYITGILFLETLNGYYFALYKNAFGYQNLIYNTLVTIEESCEMLGLILFIRALIDYLSTHFHEFSIQFHR